ncbi:hypothetical protein PR048_027982 [Dryococelus australis]|uniref:Uncharacterized protein n=1 Tax=Dryococelus australis TaxID=614101 RepID=A0ABQ9GI07_9NEOP|nr:hypothetical protein PR048_027982 [Dryococelus australis]
MTAGTSLWLVTAAEAELRTPANQARRRRPRDRAPAVRLGAPDDAAGRWVFTRIFRFPAPLRSGTAPRSPRFTLIGSHDFRVKSHPILSTRLDEMMSNLTSEDVCLRRVTAGQGIPTNQLRPRGRACVLVTSPERDMETPCPCHAGIQGRGKTGDPRENPPISGIVRHDPHVRGSGCDSAGYRTRFAFVGGE